MHLAPFAQGKSAHEVASPAQSAPDLPGGQRHVCSLAPVAKHTPSLAEHEESAHALSEFKWLRELQSWPEINWWVINSRVN